MNQLSHVGYMGREIDMKEEMISLILSGSIEEARDPSYKKKVGVVSVVYISKDKGAAKAQLEKLSKEHPENFYRAYKVPMNVDLTQLDHYPSLEISKEDIL